MISVRPATIKDEPALLALLLDLHAKNDAGWGHPYNLQKVKARIEAGTRPDFATRTYPEDRRCGFIGVIGPEGGRLIGSVGLFIEEFFWFSDAPSLIETWLYVAPGERRHAQYVRDLMAFSREQHERLKGVLAEYNAPMLLLTGFVHAPVEDDKKVEPLRRLWRKLSGAREIGVLFGRR